MTNGKMQQMSTVKIFLSVICFVYHGGLKFGWNRWIFLSFIGKMLPDPLNFDRICRVCMSTSEQLFNLFKTEEHIMSLLVSMTDISVSFVETVPLQMY